MTLHFWHFLLLFWLLLITNLRVLNFCCEIGTKVSVFAIVSVFGVNKQRIEGPWTYLHFQRHKSRDEAYSFWSFCVVKSAEGKNRPILWRKWQNCPARMNNFYVCIQHPQGSLPCVVLCFVPHFHPSLSMFGIIEQISAQLIDKHDVRDVCPQQLLVWRLAP